MMIRGGRRATLYLIQWNGVSGVREIHFILLSPFSANSKLCEKQKEISSKLSGENCVQKWIRTRVDGIEEHQEYLRLCYVNKWVAGERSQPKEGDGSPAGEVCENLFSRKR